MSRVSSPVEDLEGVGGDPGVGHEPSVEADIEGDPLDVVDEPGVDPGVVVGVFVVLVLLLKLRFKFQLELSELLSAFLLFKVPPVRAEGAGTLGEGDLGGGQPNVEGQLALLGEVRQLAGQRLRIRQFHN